jgi:hypothetical protein
MDFVPIHTAKIEELFILKAQIRIILYNPRINVMFLKKKE